MPGDFSNDNDDFDFTAGAGEVADGLGLDLDLDSGSDDGNVDLPNDNLAGSSSPAGGNQPTPPAPAAASPTPQPAVPGALTPPDPTAEPPKTWRKEATAAWASLPPEVRAEIHKREADMFTGLDTYRSDATFGKSLKQVLEPYLPVLQQAGIEPARQVQGLMQAHHTLVFGTPEQKLEMFSRFARDYGVDLAQLDPSLAPHVDPAVAGLRSELQGLKSELATAKTAQMEAAKAEYQRQIETFAADPANLYFDEVANSMATLLERGVCKTLQEAYNQAVWTTPAVRDKEMARLETERAKKSADEAAAKAAAAKKATAANVRTSAKSGATSTPLGSMDDTLNEALAAIRARG